MGPAKRGSNAHARWRGEEEKEEEEEEEESFKLVLRTSVGE